MTVVSAIFGLLLATAPEEVSVCQLSLEPEIWEGRIVSITAIYGSGYHGFFLYDENCLNDDAYMAVGCGDVGTRKCVDALDRIYAEMPYGDSTGARLRVVMTGVLRGWNGSGFGPLTGMRQRFEIRDVLSISRVAEDVPWPTSDELSGTFMPAVREIEKLDDHLMAGVVAGNAKVLDDLLPSDFRFLTTGGALLSKLQFLDALEPFCGNEQYSYSGRKIYVSGDVAYVQGYFACGLTSDEEPTLYRYASVAVRVSRTWRYSLFQCDGIRP